jgi:uncharacterized protein YecE (DUF72 family)
MTAVAIPLSSRSWKERASVVQHRMTTTDLKNLLERVQAWPEEAQDELVAVANQIESELQGQDYLATREELRIIDAAMASIDAGEAAADAEVKAAFAKFRRA